MNVVHIWVSARTLFLAITLYSLWLGDYASTIVNGTVFCLTAVIPMQGGKKYFLADAYLIGIFSLSALTWILLPSVAATMRNPVFGIDDLFHFLGGTALGWIGFLYFKDTKKTLLATLFVVLGWEAFELVMEQFGVFHAGMTDSVLDIVLGMVGAGIVAYLKGQTDRKR